MSHCFSCGLSRSKDKGKDNGRGNKVGAECDAPPNAVAQVASDTSKVVETISSGSSARGSSRKSSSRLKEFTFRELVVATKNFQKQYILGAGGFGRVYKGYLENTRQDVAVKQLNQNGRQGNREFGIEVLMLSLLRHPNLVKLIGYCSDGDQRLLVYEFMPLGSLEDNLFNLPPHKQPLDWKTRMKIVVGTAKGLEYLHVKTHPPVIFRDLKPSNVLLDEGFNPKISDFGFARLGPVGDKTHVTTRVMGTHGYCAPEYVNTGRLTLRSDIFCFGVLLLEILTGRRVLEKNRPREERFLVKWALPALKDRSKLKMIADPLLQGRFPEKEMRSALVIAAICLHPDSYRRPVIGDVVTALGRVVSKTYVQCTADSNMPGASTSSGENMKDLEYSSADSSLMQSGHHSAPVLRLKEPANLVSSGAKAGRSEPSGSHRDSPRHSKKAKHFLETNPNSSSKGTGE